MVETPYKIKEHLLCFPISEESIFHKELNLISWYGKKPKYDLRGWNADRSRMTKGISLSEEEFNALKEYLGGR